MKRYNLYFNFMGRAWAWRNITIDKIKDITINHYSSLIKHFDKKIYSDLLLDLRIDKNFTNLAYFKNGKKFISIRGCNL